jgi:predicted DNA-binding transcriptional regulator YafY
MPRNDQVTRQWHLIRHLEDATRGATLPELAAALPSELTRHHRTIRRDLEALEAAGFPLLTDRVEGRVVWKLVEGFRRISALTFSPTELMALTFSRGLLRPLEGTHLQAALYSALSKAAAALPGPGHTYLRQLDGLFAIGLGPHKSYRDHRETIDRLTEAIGGRRTVQIRYFSASRNTSTRREVDPYRLWYTQGGLYLVAYCHWRREVRLFAVERIRGLTLTDHPFQLPLNFDLEAYVRDTIGVMRGQPSTVELVLDKATAAWAKDRIWHPSQQISPQKDGRLLLTLKVAVTPELVGWVLSFGGGATVLRPDELRAAVRTAAERILART